MTDEENVQSKEDDTEELVNYNFRGLGMGEIGGIVDRLKILATGIHDISDRRNVWEFVETPNDIFANMNLMLVYSHEAMRADYNEKGEIELLMHDQINNFGVTEVNLATMVLNIIDLCQERGIRLPEAMMAVYEYRVKLLQQELKAQQEADSSEKH